MQLMTGDVMGVLEVVPVLCACLAHLLPSPTVALIVPSLLSLSLYTLFLTVVFKACGRRQGRSPVGSLGVYIVSSTDNLTATYTHVVSFIAGICVLLEPMSTELDSLLRSTSQKDVCGTV
jgi:hypothetical protein